MSFNPLIRAFSFSRRLPSTSTKDLHRMLKRLAAARLIPISEVSALDQTGFLPERRCRCAILHCLRSAGDVLAARAGFME
jgi:hypothetical protein